MKGTGAGQLNEPHRLAVDGDGNIWVADSGRAMLIEFSRSGGYLGEIYCHLMSISFDSSGNFWWSGFTGPGGGYMMAKRDPSFTGMGTGCSRTPGAGGFRPLPGDSRFRYRPGHG